MSQQLTKIGAPLYPSVEVSYLIDGIKAYNNEINMVKVTAKRNTIEMAIYFEAAVIHISGCLPSFWSTHSISSVEMELEEADGGSDLGNISAVQQK